MSAFNQRTSGRRFGLPLFGAWLLGLSEFFALARSRWSLRNRRSRAM